MSKKSVKPRATNRRDLLLEIAATQFVRNGFIGASMRDIAAAADMQPSSIYYHYASKEDLMLAVYEEGMTRIRRAVEDALEGLTTEPWERLECACAAHLTALLKGGDIFKALMRETPEEWLHKENRMKQMRDSYESIIAGLIDDLPMPKGTDRRVMRLMLVGAMNWAHTWYQPKAGDPKKLAHQFVSLLRGPLGAAD